MCHFVFQWEKGPNVSSVPNNFECEFLCCVLFQPTNEYLTFFFVFGAKWQSYGEDSLFVKEPLGNDVLVVCIWCPVEISDDGIDESTGKAYVDILIFNPYDFS